MEASLKGFFKKFFRTFLLEGLDDDRNLHSICFCIPGYSITCLQKNVSRDKNSFYRTGADSFQVFIKYYLPLTKDNTLYLLCFNIGFNIELVNFQIEFLI